MRDGERKISSEPGNSLSVAAARGVSMNINIFRFIYLIYAIESVKVLIALNNRISFVASDQRLGDEPIQNNC